MKQSSALELVEPATRSGRQGVLPGEKPLVVLNRICRRHGLPLEEARALLPFLSRATSPSNRNGRWMLEAVDAVVERRAGELRARKTRAPAGPIPRSLSQWIP